MGVLSKSWDAHNIDGLLKFLAGTSVTLFKPDWHAFYHQDTAKQLLAVMASSLVELDLQNVGFQVDSTLFQHIMSTMTSIRKLQLGWAYHLILSDCQFLPNLPLTDLSLIDTWVRLLMVFAREEFGSLLHFRSQVLN